MWKYWLSLGLPWKVKVMNSSETLAYPQFFDQFWLVFPFNLHNLCYKMMLCGDFGKEKIIRNLLLGQNQ
jgi:hypothetical protein